MRAPLYQVDAFADAPLRGNPAAVMILEDDVPDVVLQAIAAENNLSETAFVWRLEPGRWRLRWFTPTTEVDLCGHATLAAGCVALHRGEGVQDEHGHTAARFESASGSLIVRRDGERLTMDLPAVPVLGPLRDPDLSEILGQPAELWRIKEVHHGRYALAVVDNEAVVAGLQPDLDALAALRTNVLVTSRGHDVDVVSRFFAPASGVAEDPVTGSAHCTLAPFWSERLGQDRLHCRQISHRPGDVWTRVEGRRVHLTGHAALFFEGTAHLPRF